MQRLWRVGSHARRNSRALLWPIPSLQARPPAAYVLTIRLVLSTKFPAERRFFMQDYEQMHAKTNSWRSVLSERQSPQVIVFSEKLSEKGERLDRAFVRPGQACLALTDESMLCYNSIAGQGQLLWVGVCP